MSHALHENEPPYADDAVMAELAVPREYLSLDEFLVPSDNPRFTNIRSVNARPWVREMRAQYDDESLTIASFTPEMWENVTFGKSIKGTYIIGIFESSEAAREESKKELPEYQRACRDPALQEVDGSSFAKKSNKLHPMVAKDWEDWKEKIYKPLKEKGIELGMDYIPNHVALDHPWRDTHPEYLLQVDKETADAKPGFYYEYKDKKGIVHYYAVGKHYTVEGKEEKWPDTLQLDYRNPLLRKEMIRQLVFLVDKGDFARVDTAILPVFEIFKKTWGDIVPVTEYWDFWGEAMEAVNKRANELGKTFKLLGEAYDSGHVLKDFYSVYGSAIYGELVNITNNRGNIHDVIRELQRAYHRAKHGGFLDLLFAENHDLLPTVEIFENYQKMLAALSVTIMTPGDWLLHYGEELLRLNPPMQITKPYTHSLLPHLVDDLRLQYERWFAIRNSKIAQEGSFELLNTSTPTVIAQKHEYDNKGLIMCTNLSEQITGAWIPLSPGLTKDDIDVFDLDTLTFVDHNVITDPAINNGHVYVELAPWHRQLVMCKKSSSGKIKLKDAA